MAAEEKINQLMMGSSEIPAKKIKLKPGNIMVKKENQKKKKKKIKVPSHSQIKNKNCFDRNLVIEGEQHEQILEALKELGITDPLFVLSKKITSSDTTKQQNCLLLPCDTSKSSRLFELITGEEKAQMKKKQGLNRKVLDQLKREYFMTLKYLGSNKAPRIIGPDWRRYVNNNTVEEGQILDLWGFRVEKGTEKQKDDRVLQLAILNYEITEKVIEVGDHVEETKDFPPDVIEGTRALMS
ncbi:uncharacterized protein LOC120110402 [Phoenix dactylifera]|uniref:Uncharacterized protein LOC120110402 n=1 Tax=Phoenix dactylifera TaxID=42345 RepID=A0A8B9A645_PHODC|nr:uncharacterized protein LOC120110402 [Phoenix dactylifera]